MGWVVGIEVDGVLGGAGVGMAAHRFAGIRVDVEAWEVAAGDVDADAVSGFEEIAGRREFDGYRIDFAG